MSKLYHVTVRGNEGSQSPHQYDIIASNTAVAIKRALDTARYRTMKSITVQAEVSNHGEYDKAEFVCKGERDQWVSPKDKDGNWYRVPSHIRRAEQAERLGIEAQRILDKCPGVTRVIAKCRTHEVDITRAGASSGVTTRTPCDHRAVDLEAPSHTTVECSECWRKWHVTVSVAGTVDWKEQE